MPTATATRRKQSAEKLSSPAIAVLMGSEQPADPAAKLFNPFDEAVPFFDALAMITENEWRLYAVYLYRLEPRVRNPVGEAAFISTYQQAIDEADIKATHGGGKYLLYLKEVVMGKRDPSLPAPRERSWKCRIAGEPILQPSQTLVMPAGNVPALPAGPTDVIQQPRTGTSDVAVLANVLRDLIENKNSGRGNSEAMALMGEANKSALSIVTEAARQTVTTSTGSAMGDKLLERLLDSKFNGKSSDSDLRDKLALIAIDRLSNPQPESKDPLGQLSFVKDLLGVDSITDLIRPSGDGAWKTRLVEIGAALVTTLPQLVGAFMTNQERQFQHQMQIEAMRRQSGQASPPVAVNVPTLQLEPVPAAPVGTPQPQPMGESPMENLFNPAQMALEEIVVDFGEGLDGTITARLVRQRYPQIVESLKPLIQDSEQVKLFAQNTPPLSEIAGEEEFPEFLTQFTAEILHPATDDSEGEGETTA
jgi:hypothetical protein